jgi:beta-lactamase superfamily II metal-dependent hydrolase
MQFSATRALRRVPFFIPILIIAACGSDTGTTDVPDPPQITITGVADSATYTGPVTIAISVDKGAYDATLDGAPFNAGGTVQAPGAHTLVVNAHESTRLSSKTVHFTIQMPGVPGGALIIRMFDLGPNNGAPGDAILLTDSTAAGKVNVLIDAGPSGLNSEDAAFVRRKLTALEVDTLYAMLLTHAHEDHFKGMQSILTAQKVQRFLYSGQVRSLASYTNMLAQAAVSADSMITVTDSIRPYTIGYGSPQTSIKFLRPLQTYIAKNTSDGTELNEGSVGARLDLGSFSMFFTGDSEVDATARWRTNYVAFTRNLTVLKVGHHGANNAIFDNGFSGTSTWLDVTAPKVSIISGNGVSHPRMFALARLQQQPGNAVYCTNTHGTITIVVTRDGNYTVSVEKNANLPCEKGTNADT